MSNIGLLLQGDYAALRIVYKFLPTHAAYNFLATCQAFKAVADESKKQLHFFFWGHKKWELAKIMQAKHVTSVKFNQCIEFVKPILLQFGAQLQQLSLWHVGALDTSYLTQVQFLHVTFLELSFFVKCSIYDKVKFWLALNMPKLQTLSLELKKHDPTGYSSQHNDHALELISVVKHVPRLQLKLRGFELCVAAAFKANLYELEATFFQQEWLQHVNECQLLESLQVSASYGVVPDGNAPLKLPNITSLAMYDFSFQDDQEQDQFFSTLPASIEFLTFTYCKFISFPAIQHLQNLTSLVFTYSTVQATMVPLWIANMNALTNVDFSFKDFGIEQQIVTVSKLPKAVNYLQAISCDLDLAECINNKMTSIDLSECNVHNLEDAAAKFGTKLYSFFLDACKKVEFESGTFDYSKFKYLRNISIQNCTLIPNIHMREWHCVTHLYLQKCKLSAVPEELGHLPVLASLNVSGNMITNIDNVVAAPRGQFEQLEDLNILDNPFTQYPAVISIPNLCCLRAAPLVHAKETTPLIKPANVNRAEWTSIALQHFKNIREQKSTRLLPGYPTIKEVYLAYAIPCTNNFLILGAHMLCSTFYMNTSTLSAEAIEENGTWSLFVNLNKNKVVHCLGFYGQKCILDTKKHNYRINKSLIFYFCPLISLFKQWQNQIFQPCGTTR